jgi:hypothetical protein
MKRVIVTVANGTRPNVGKPEGALIGTSFEDKINRWISQFAKFGGDTPRLVFKQLPPGSPAHLDNPYAFKIYAIEEAIKLAYTHILWADSSVVAVRSVEPIWSKINNEGYWLSRNRLEHTCGEWTSDAALPILGTTREEAFKIPQTAGTAFGVNISHPTGKKFFEELKRLERAGAFKGPWVNDHGEASEDRRVKGHRHDQTAASVVAHQMKLKLTVQPAYFSDHHGETDETILTVQR